MPTGHFPLPLPGTPGRQDYGSAGRGGLQDAHPRTWKDEEDPDTSVLRIPRQGAAHNREPVRYMPRVCIARRWQGFRSGRRSVRSPRHTTGRQVTKLSRIIGRRRTAKSFEALRRLFFQDSPGPEAGGTSPEDEFQRQIEVLKSRRIAPEPGTGPGRCVRGGATGYHRCFQSLGRLRGKPGRGRQEYTPFQLVQSPRIPKDGRSVC